MCKKYNIDAEESCVFGLGKLWSFLQIEGNTLPEEDILNYFKIYYIGRKITEKILHSPFSVFIDSDCSMGIRK